MQVVAVVVAASRSASMSSSRAAQLRTLGPCPCFRCSTAVRSTPMPVRLPRWTWWIALPMLVGSLLLMHGLGTHGGDAHPSGTSAASPSAEGHGHGRSTSGDDGCVECQVMVSCVAIVTAIGGMGLVRRLMARVDPAFPATCAAGRPRTSGGMARPPDPAWVQLSVMRC